MHAPPSYEFNATNGVPNDSGYRKNGQKLAPIAVLYHISFSRQLGRASYCRAGWDLLTYFLRSALSTVLWTFQLTTKYIAPFMSVCCALPLTMAAMKADLLSS